MAWPTWNSESAHDPKGRETRFMKAYLVSFVVGVGVGLLYAAIRVKSPAPPLVALIGLLGMVLGEEALQYVSAVFGHH